MCKDEPEVAAVAVAAERRFGGECVGSSWC